MKANSKKMFSIIFLLLALMLVLLPFVASFSDILTRIFLSFGWYRHIERFVTPFETRAIAGILKIIGYKAEAASNTVSIFRNGVWETVTITWNCVGWQSLILMVITLFFGLREGFTRASKVQAVLMGISGVIIVNYLRVAIIVYLIFNFNQIPATVLHDYLSAFILIFWLFLFWWFVYSFVLEEREERIRVD